MKSFGWKKKSQSLTSGLPFPKSVSPDNSAANVSSAELNTADAFTKGVNYDWCSDLKKHKLEKSPETGFQSINRLKDEGIKLIEKEEYWQAIGRWDAALTLIQKVSGTLNENNENHVEQFHEMKAQALIQLHEWEPAIESAESALLIDPMWYPAHQTLGRAHLGVGNVAGAVKAFSRARHINPEDEEIKIQDLEWAASLLTHQKLMSAAREINQREMNQS